MPCHRLTMLALSVIAMGVAMGGLRVPRVSAAPACANTSFVAAAPVTVGPSVGATVAGDWNGDGHPDLAVVLENAAQIAIFLGDGSGNFRLHTTLTPWAIGALAVADFNQDSILDLVMTADACGQVLVYLGAGGGNFAPPRPFALPSGGALIPVVGDFNADGIPDVAVALSNRAQVAVLLGDGAGGLGPVQTFDVGGTPLHMAVGDSNADGHLDLVLATRTLPEEQGAVAVLRGSGTGRFAAATPVAVGALQHPTFVAIADFNGDRVLDLAVADTAIANAVLLFGDNTGGFAPPLPRLFIAGAETFAVADFNRDRILDLAVPGLRAITNDIAVSTSNETGVGIVFGDGLGGFGVPTTFPTGPGPDRVVVGDWNSDGRPDLAVTNAGDDIAILLNMCEGAPPLALSQAIPNQGGDTGSVTVVLYGQGFETGAEVQLARSDQLAIPGGNIAVSTANALTATFDLRGQARGLWDVVVSLPDGRSATLPGGLTIEEGRFPQIWTDVLAPNLITARTPTVSFTLVGNRGNVDAPVAIVGGVIQSPNGNRTISQPPLVYAPLPPGVTQEVYGNFALPERGTYELQAFALPIARDRSAAPGLTTETTVSAPPVVEGCLLVPPGDDLPGIAFARVVAEDRFPIDNFLTRVISGLPDLSESCVSTTADRNKALADLSKLPSSPLAGWQFGSITIQELGAAPGTGPHTMTLMVSPHTGQVYGLDNYWRPVVLCMEERRPGVYIITDLLRGLDYGLLDGPWVPTAGTPRCARAQQTATKTVRAVASSDPNAKVGAQGAGPAQHISGAEPLRYAIFFENLATATAPAKVVQITDQLDPTRVNLRTFRLGPITFGSTVITPPQGLSTFTTDVDLQPERNLVVRVEAHLTLDTGQVTWTLTALDPVTLQPPTDPLTGFLPPNQSPPEGQGVVVFTVMPHPELPTGTEVHNQATIVFDTNPPLDTDIWRNTLDTTTPTSQVLPLAAVQQSLDFAVQWSGTDLGAGIKDYTIFVAEDGRPFTVWLRDTPETSGRFVGQHGKTYAFYSVARDHTHNLETPPGISDTTTRIAVVLPGDLDGDHDVDRDDLAILLRDRNKSVAQSACGAPCDLDHNGLITVLDARKLVLLCTRPLCETH